MTLPPIWPFAGRAQCAQMVCPSSWTKSNTSGFRESRVNPAVLEIDGLQTHFFTAVGTVRAVDGVSYALKPGETLGVVGESGCGKSGSALSILRLVATPPGRIVGGQIRFN